MIVEVPRCRITGRSPWWGSLDDTDLDISGDYMLRKGGERRRPRLVLITEFHPVSCLVWYESVALRWRGTVDTYELSGVSTCSRASVQAWRAWRVASKK